MAFSVIEIDDSRLDQLVDNVADTAEVERVLQAMADRGDYSVIDGWHREVDMQIEVHL